MPRNPALMTANLAGAFSFLVPLVQAFKASAQKPPGNPKLGASGVIDGGGRLITGLATTVADLNPSVTVRLQIDRSWPRAARKGQVRRHAGRSCRTETVPSVSVIWPTDLGAKYRRVVLRVGLWAWDAAAMDWSVGGGRSLGARRPLEGASHSFFLKCGLFFHKNSSGAVCPRERGIPAISAVMGTKRLPFPGRVFDAVHCARCRVPWHIEGGKLLLELNRLLRPGGYFVWSATPVYQKLPEDVEIWEAMSALTRSMCWNLVNKVKDRINRVGVAIFQKPMDNRCYDGRSGPNPPLCGEYDNPDAAWNVSLQSCMHKLPADPAVRGSRWPEEWPLRVERPPYWLKSSEAGVYGKPAPEDFQADYEHWKRVIRNSYMEGLGIDWSAVRNVMDMKAVYRGFAAALRNMKVWVMNVVPIDSPDTLPIIYERGLFGLYHDWCESFSTYPRSYDLVHADHLFSKIKKRCGLLGVIVEVDQIVRPEGRLIVRDDMETIREVESIVKSLHWEVRLSYSQDKEGLLFVQKTMWRPDTSSS